jgi:integrase
MYIEQDSRTGKFVVRWRDANGKKRRDEHTWDSKSDANLRKKELEKQQRNNALGLFKEITLNEARPIFERLHFPRLQNDAVRNTYRNHFTFLCTRWGNRTLKQITYNEVVDCWNEMLAAGYKRATPMKYLMLLYCVYERFRFWNEMVPNTMPEKVALPDINPVKLAKEYLGEKKISTWGFNRKRRVSEEELQRAKAWCAENDPELWEAIKLAIWTALRKSDMKNLNAGQIDIVQQKTSVSQKMPIELRNMPNFGNLRTRWDYLRGAMGWLKKDTPLHTTWHDLRHCAPSMLADEGFEPAIIAQYLGHTDTKMARTYTHPSGKAIEPAVKFMERKLEAL